MTDNVRLNLGAAGDLAATDEVAYSGDTAQVQLVRVVGVTGTEGSKTVGANDSVALLSRIPVQGQALMAASMPVVIASDQSAIPTVAAATYITGQSAQTAVVNNIIPSTSGATGTDALNLRSASVQVVSTGTAGTFIFEQSNDNVSWIALPVFNAALATGVVIAAAITATVSQIVYTFPIRCRYIRLRIATTITGGSIQAFSRLSMDSWTAAVQQVANNTAANLAVTASGTVTANQGTMVALPAGTAAIGAVRLTLPETNADVASAAITTTTTTAAFTPTAGHTYQVNIPVTAVSGTTPTLDVAIEESDDAGTNWFKVYDFPRITATGIYRSPKLPLTGNRVRYVQTLTGTTPSFTRAINRLMSSDDAPHLRQIIDRTVSLTTLNSATPNLDARHCRNAQLVINLGAASTPPAIQVEGSDDNGATWYAVGAPLTGVASSTVQLTVNNVQAALLRGRVSTAGVTVTPGYVLIKGF